jgi:hypothetical protein
MYAIAPLIHEFAVPLGCFFETTLARIFYREFPLQINCPASNGFLEDIRIIVAMGQKGRCELGFIWTFQLNQPNN